MMRIVSAFKIINLIFYYLSIMFKKFKKKETKFNRREIEELNINIQEEDNEDIVEEIKSAIDKKIKKRHKGIPVEVITQQEKPIVPIVKEEERENSIRKIFISESLLKDKNEEELEKVLGVKREKVEEIKLENKKGLIQMNKEIFSLPDNLNVQASTKNNYIETLLNLSNAGLIEIPKPLEDKLKNYSGDTTLNNRETQELNLLKALSRLIPPEVKYKSDLNYNKLGKIKEMFENVFTDPNGRKMKFRKEKQKEESRNFEKI